MNNPELRIYVDQQQQEVIPLCSSSAWVVGSSEGADICLPYRGVSGKHCIVEIRGGDRYSVQDLNSKNGTKVNGRRVVGNEELREGDLIQLGYVTIVFLAVGTCTGDCSDDKR